jgi:transposase
MAGRRSHVFDVQEMIRRFRLGQGDSEIARDLAADRGTVAKYREIAKTEGWLEQGVVPTLEAIHKGLEARKVQGKPGPGSTVQPWHEQVMALRKKGIEVQALYQILKERHGYEGSYSAVRRYVRKIEPVVAEAFVRVETPPGAEAQVDFGSAGLRLDESTGELRKSWVFVMGLSWSRNLYTEVVFNQKVETWLALHIRAFEHFGGIPARLVIDNLKAAITKACFHDPVVQQSYRELAEHYGFTISPCRIKTPRHKGKVESNVHYVVRNGLAGWDGQPLRATNEHLMRWAMETAGTRIHGTTHERPLDRFLSVEKAALRPLPPTRYEPAVWREVKLHPDCHVVFDNAYYSAPARYVGRKMMLNATAEKVDLFYEWSHVATHPRAKRRGQRLTNLDHLPPEKVQGLLPAPTKVREEAAAIGSGTADVVERLLGDRPLDRLRGAQGIVALARKHGKERLEKACLRALAFDDIRYSTIRNILRNGKEADPPTEYARLACPLPAKSAFARKPEEFRAVSS